jgi:hypothetical protein
MVFAIGNDFDVLEIQTCLQRRKKSFLFNNRKQPNVMAEWLACVFHILEVHVQIFI